MSETLSTDDRGPRPDADDPRGSRVLVLAGGLSHERDVSIRSGRRVGEALRQAGFEVEERDVDATLLPAMAGDRPGMVFPLLHGDSGEDGSIREVLELLQLPYVGSRPPACRVAFDKPVAKSVVAREGLHTPTAVVLPHETFRELGASAVMDHLVEQIGMPLIVKPTRGGSSLGCRVVFSAEELPSAMVACFSYGPVALVERFVSGTEVAVTVVEDADGPRTLPPVEIEARSGRYDFSARYTAGETEFVTPARLSSPIADEVSRVALSAHRALGLRDLSRSDLIVDPDGLVWFLEANVAPGMTETSLVPLAIEESRTTLSQLCATLVRRAASRR